MVCVCILTRLQALSCHYINCHNTSYITTPFILRAFHASVLFAIWLCYVLCKMLNSFFSRDPTSQRTVLNYKNLCTIICQTLNYFFSFRSYLTENTVSIIESVFWPQRVLNREQSLSSLSLSLSLSLSIYVYFNHGNPGLTTLVLRTIKMRVTHKSV